VHIVGRRQPGRERNSLAVCTWARLWGRAFRSAVYCTLVENPIERKQRESVDRLTCLPLWSRASFSSLWTRMGDVHPSVRALHSKMLLDVMILFDRYRLPAKLARLG
jgi:hypothetical protein